MLNNAVHESGYLAYLVVLMIFDCKLST